MKVTIFKGHDNEYEKISERIALRLTESGIETFVEDGCLCEHPHKIENEVALLHPHHYTKPEDADAERECLKTCLDSVKESNKTKFYVLALARINERKSAIGELPNVAYLTANDLAVLYNFPARLFRIK